MQLDINTKNNKIAEYNQTISDKDHTIKIQERDFDEKLGEMKKKTDKEVSRLNRQLGIKENLIQKEIKENNAEFAKVKTLDEQILKQQA